MARPLSEDKRNAILDAANEIVATLGVGAPTAKIAEKAGVAEGTLFTYFANKDELLNTLYFTLKTELAQVMSTEHCKSHDIRERCRYVWERYIQWGSKYPLKHKAVHQLAVSDRVTEATRKAARGCMENVAALLHEAAASQDTRTVNFRTAILAALADVTLDFIAREPRQAKHYTQIGFDAFWRAIGR